MRVAEAVVVGESGGGCGGGGGDGQEVPNYASGGGNKLQVSAHHNWLQTS